MAHQPTPVHYWLFKSEPAVFGIGHLRKKKVAVWDGVRNYQVRNLLCDEVRVGDRALFYPNSQYYDKGSTKAAPRWLAVKVKYVRTFSRLVSLPELRADPLLKNMRILTRGNRLSITKVTKEEYERICKLGGA
jgi:predicted RNA-binding protein with PUA-like domain